MTPFFLPWISHKRKHKGILCLEVFAMFSFDFTGFTGSNFMSLSHKRRSDVVVALTLKDFSHIHSIAFGKVI